MAFLVKPFKSFEVSSQIKIFKISYYEKKDYYFLFILVSKGKP